MRKQGILFWVAVYLFGCLVFGAFMLWILFPELGTKEKGLRLLPKSKESPPNVLFKDVTEEAGLRFQHNMGHYGEILFPEVYGPGCGFLDFDNDGDQDILIVDSGEWPHRIEGLVNSVEHALFENDGTGHFSLKKNIGLVGRSYGQGVCFGDFDNDGYVDVYVTCVGKNTLYRNIEGKHFEDVTDSARVGGSEWSVSAAFLDYDRDGYLDLFVPNYEDWSVDKEREMHKEQKKKQEELIKKAQEQESTDDKKTPAEGGGQGKEVLIDKEGKVEGKPDKRESAEPASSHTDSYAYTAGLFSPSRCTLYRNIEGKYFEDVSESAGIHKTLDSTEPSARALAVAVFDAIGDDGFPDIAVANDESEDFLFKNTGKGFVEIAGEVGTSKSNSGTSRAGMGLNWAYYLNESALALAVSNYAGQSLGFYVRSNPAVDVFVDATESEGLAGPSRNGVMWGVFFFDFDLDGRQDLFLANGHVAPGRAHYQNLPYKQSAVLYWNSGKRPAFVPMTEEQVGSEIFQPMVARGAAYGDIDGDGDLDILVVTNGGPAVLLRNSLGEQSFLRLRLQGTRSNRSAIGARIKLLHGSKLQIREVSSGGSYASQSELPVTFGLKKMPPISSIEVRWPSGLVEKYGKLSPNTEHHILEGSGVSSSLE